MIKSDNIMGLRKGVFYGIFTKGGISTEQRTEPATRDELMDAGLTEGDIDDYFELIERLYGDAIIHQNNLMTEGETCAVEIWTDLCTFCFKKHLMPEPPNHDMPPAIYFKNAVQLTMPLKAQRFREFPYASFVPNVDEYRLFIEKTIAGMGWPWELAEYCNVYLVDNDNDNGRIHEYVWDDEQSTLVPLTPSRIRKILKMIYADIRYIDQEIVNHNRNVPPCVARNDDEWNDMLRLGEEWIRERVRLEWRIQFLANCESWFNVPMPNFQKHKQGDNTDE